MSEEKVWVEKMPKSCYICPCFDTSDAMCSITGTYTKFKQGRILEDCPLVDIKDYDRELTNENRQKIIKFIEELAWRDIQFDAFQSTIGEFNGSRSAIPRYAKKYLKLWKEMFNEDLEEIQKLEAEDEQI